VKPFSIVFAAIAACLCLAPSAAAAADADEVAGPAVVSAFAHFCLDRPDNVGDFVSQLDQEADLKKAEYPADYTPGLKDIIVSRAWAYILNGKEYQLILVQTGAWHASDVRCALRIAAKETIFPYFDPFRDLMKSKGLKGRETNLPHYMRMSGKLPDGRYSEGILSSRRLFPAAPGIFTTLFVRFAR
jgi:hypothetical protein